MSDYTATSAPDASVEERNAINGFLNAHNLHVTGRDDYRPINLVLRDQEGRVVGGLLGATYWDWLYVDTLALSDAARNQGWGSRLLAMAEQEALARGCHHVYLDTFSFQALPFYQKQGYQVFGTLNRFPGDQKRYFLQKELRSL